MAEKMVKSSGTSTPPTGRKMMPKPTGMGAPPTGRKMMPKPAKKI